MNKARILNEFILEALTEALKITPKLSDDSADDQIDSVLLGYESDCIVSMEMGESRLFEAEDDLAPKKPELGDPDQAENDEVKAQTADKEDVKPDVEADPLKPKIDLKMFCGKVSRLASNYDKLLSVPIVIINRAHNYIEQNYGQALANEFAEVMENDHRVKLTQDDTSEPVEKPMAVGAAASGLG